MNASVFVIGTELTRGVISDRHIPFLCSELSKTGFTVKRAAVVPDDSSVEKELQSAVQDSDAVLLTGGLGPTSDDLTRRMVCTLASAELVKNQEAWDVLYKRIGERIYGANEIQTCIPSGFSVLPNPNGTAVGFEGFIKISGKKIYIAAMPGPPREMRPMFENYVSKSLSSFSGHEKEMRDEYSVFLTAEAKLEELCRKCRREGVSWGTRFQDFRISLYVEGQDEKERMAFAEELKALTGKALIADGDTEARDIFINTVKEKGLSVTCAESATGGLCAKLLTDVSGSSTWFWGSEVTYTDSAKKALLGVRAETLEAFNAVSSETAREMAEGSLKRSGADFSFSVTGIAGPTGALKGKDVGTVFFGFAARGRETESVRLNLFTNGRDGARRRFACAAFLLSSLYLKEISLVDITDSWLYI